MTRTAPLLVALLLAGCSVVGPRPTPTPPLPPRAYDARETFEGVSQVGAERPIELPYYVYLPEGYSAGGSYPLLVMLHGSGLDSSLIADRLEPGGPGLPDPLQRTPQEFPFIYLFPVLPPGEDWASASDVLAALVDHTIAGYAIDPDRVYLVGFSMGGAGAWVIGAIYAERFAAVAPIAGGWPSRLAIRPVPSACWLVDAGVPLWVVHSVKDEVVGVFNSDHLVRRIEDCGGEVTYTRLQEGTHVESINQAVNDPALYRWLLEHSR